MTHSTDSIVEHAQRLATSIATEAAEATLTLDERLKALGGVTSFLRAVRPSQTLVEHRHQTLAQADQGASAQCLP